MSSKYMANLCYNPLSSSSLGQATSISQAEYKNTGSFHHCLLEIHARNGSAPHENHCDNEGVWESSGRDEDVTFPSLNTLALEITSVRYRKRPEKRSKPRSQNLKAAKAFLTQSCQGGIPLGGQNQLGTAPH